MLQNLSVAAGPGIRYTLFKCKVGAVQKNGSISLMRLIKKALRPIYKAFVEKPLWWFLSRVKAYFLAEIGPQIAAIEERTRVTDAHNTAQWNALEQLLLAMYRQPEVRPESSRVNVSPTEKAIATAVGQGRTNERNDLR